MLLLAAPAISHADSSEAAQDVTALVSVVSEQDGRTIRRTRDSHVETYSTFAPEEAFSFVWSEDTGVRLASIKWYAPPDSAILVQTDAQGKEIARELLDASRYNVCCDVLEDARGLSVVSQDGMTIAELTLYSAGTLPDGVYDWQPPLEKADLLVVAAHCDDELLFFGGTIPYYAGERGLDVQVAYMANGDRTRVDEALNGLWHCGVRNAPVFLPLKDVYTETLRDALIRWGREQTTDTLVLLIRRFRPEVIVTHDLNGEYGHGAHMASAACMLDAVPLASDASADPASAETYGVWQAQKLYLHLYGENRITMNWDEPLSAFGGKTALEVANNAYHMHVSQLQYHRNVFGSGDYSSAEFGLALTAVGPDEAKDDFFEHIDPARLSDYIAPTPEPTATQTMAPTSTPTATPEQRSDTEQNSAANSPWMYGALGLIGLAAAAGIIAVICNRKRKTGV